MKKYFVLIIVVFIIILAFLIIFIQNNNSYFLKINIKLDNFNPNQIDRIVAEEIKDKLFQIPEIKDIVIFSRYKNCSVYLKKDFFASKTKVLSLVELKLNRFFENAEADFGKNPEIDYDDNFDVNFQNFLIITTDSDYFTLKNNSDEIYDRIIDLNITKKILNFEPAKKASYIYFTNDKLVKYNINLDDIRNILIDNNLIISSCLKTSSKNSFIINSNLDYKSIDDIKKLAIFYRDKDFSNRLGEIFEIKNEVITPREYCLGFNHKKAQIIALKKKDYYPWFLFELKLRCLIGEFQKNYPFFDFAYINARNLSKTEVYFNNEINFDTLYLKYKQIDEQLKLHNINNAIFFIGIQNPKISPCDVFFELQKNKITILSPYFAAVKIRKILDELNFNYTKQNDRKITLCDCDIDKLYKKTQDYKNRNIVNATDAGCEKSMTIEYLIDDFSLNDFLITKKDVLDAVFASNDGLNILDYIDLHNDKVPIIIKCSDSKDKKFVYSKNYQTLLDLKNFYKEKIEPGFIVIARKNDYYFTTLFKK